MRKKLHKRINPDNRAYDKFFLVNYKLDKLEQYQSGPKVGSEEPSCFNNDELEDDHWSDWGDEDETEVICLFCPKKATKSEDMRTHLLNEHHFELGTKKYNFYEKVKLINFVRRQMHLVKCISCDEQFDKLVDLQQHMTMEKHDECDRKLWDKPEYFFPTFEDDALLYQIDDDLNENDEFASDDSGAIVIPEESTANVNEDAELLSREGFEM